jgi:hypothetical protein
MSYIVPDSTLYKTKESYGAYDQSDTAIRVGIVRKAVEHEDVGTKYTVEVFMGGNQIPVSCVPMSRFNSPYNFEEIRLKPWLRGPAASGFMDPGTASTYNFRDGEHVVVAFLDGKAREGVILGTIKHPSRPPATPEATLCYHSVYNGLETKIDPEGAYTVTFQGAPLNDKAPLIPGITEVTAVQYSPDVAGSFYGFDATGSFSIDCSNEVGTNMIKITRDLQGGTMLIESGQNVISIGGNPAQGELSITTGKLALETFEVSIKAQTAFKVEATTAVSIKGLQVAIGNDTIELVDGLLQIIDGLGQITVTSPVGTCTPIMASPQWASGIIPLIVKLNTLKGSL